MAFLRMKYRAHHSAKQVLGAAVRPMGSQVRAFEVPEEQRVLPVEP